MENVLFNVVKHETGVKGYWKDISNKVYIDNIQPLPIKNANEFEQEINRLFLLGEKAVFVIGRKSAFVIYPNGEQTELKNNVILHYTKEEFKAIKSELLEKYKGFTVYNDGEYIKVSIWN